MKHLQEYIEEQLGKDQIDAANERISIIKKEYRNKYVKQYQREYYKRNTLFGLTLTKRLHKQLEKEALQENLRLPKYIKEIIVRRNDEGVSKASISSIKMYLLELRDIFEDNQYHNTPLSIETMLKELDKQISSL